MAQGMAEEGEGSAARILEAAMELLIKDGYESLSMRKLGARVGLSQAAIYRHYRDKADLVATIVETGYRRLLPRLEAAVGGGATPRESLARGIRAYVGFALDYPDLFKAVLLKDLGPASKAVEAFSEGVSRRRRSFALLTTALAQGMESGVFAPGDPELTAQALWSGMFGLAARLALEAGRGKDRTALIERFIEINLAGLEA